MKFGKLYIPNQEIVSAFFESFDHTDADYNYYGNYYIYPMVWQTKFKIPDNNDYFSLTDNNRKISFNKVGIYNLQLYSVYLITFDELAEEPPYNVHIYPEGYISTIPSHVFSSEHQALNNYFPFKTYITGSPIGFELSKPANLILIVDDLPAYIKFYSNTFWGIDIAYYSYVYITKVK